MAEYCTKCSEVLFGKDNKPDIDVQAIANSLPHGRAEWRLCEGCSFFSIGKDKDGKVRVFGPYPDTPEVAEGWLPYEEYWEKYQQVKPR